MTSNGPEVASAPKEVESSRQVDSMESKSIKGVGRQHALLHPLATSQINSHIYQYSNPHLNHTHPEYCVSPETPNSAISLATPSLLGVRQYYLENGLYTVFQAQSPHLPTSARSRRVSGLSASSLTPRFNRLQASSSLSPGSSPKFPQRSFAEESRNMLLAGTNRHELSREGHTAVDSNGNPDRRTSDPQLNRPSRPPLDRLRDYGYMYLGNVATADVFVRALHIWRPSQDKERRDSVMSNNGEDDSCITVPQSDEDHVVVRARIIPYSKQRKPFLIQRRFNKADIEAARPARSEETKGEEKKDKSDLTSVKGDEGARTKEKMSGAQVSQENSASTPSPQPGSAASPTPLKEIIAPTTTGPKRRVMPIHMDYALKYLPLLGAIMLSGHIRKGDTIDIPLPHPEAWSDTVAYVYTGAWEASEAVMANVVYLAGNVEEKRKGGG